MLKMDQIRIKDLFWQSGTEKGKTPEGRDSNIKIIGEGVAIIDGGVYNGLSEKTQRKNGMPPIWKNNLILFSSVQGFEIRNISCHNQRWWAINLLFCSDGYISNIDFRANDIWIDENGEKIYSYVENENPMFGSSNCGEAWYIPELIQNSKQPMEILIHNPHKFGTETAIYEMLSTMVIVM